MEWHEFFARVFTLTLMLVGLFGVVSPFLHGIHLIWFAAFLYAVVTGFQEIGLAFLGLMAVLVLLTYTLDFWTIHWQLREFRTTPWGVAGAVVGSMVGSMFGLFYGLTIGPILGAVVGEMLVGRDSVFAIETDNMKFVGFIGSSVVKIVMGVIMIGSWLVALR